MGGPTRTRTWNLAFGVRCFTIETIGPLNHILCDLRLYYHKLRLLLLVNSVFADERVVLFNFELFLHGLLVLAGVISISLSYTLLRSYHKLRLLLLVNSVFADERVVLFNFELFLHGLLVLAGVISVALAYTLL